MIETLLLLCLAGLSAGIMWTIQFRWERSVFSEWKGRGMIWLSPLGWHLKYKNGDPKKGPAFPGSTSIFVWLTDGFHFFQFVMFTSFELAIIKSGFHVVNVGLPCWAMLVLDLAVLKGCRGFFFEITFQYLLNMSFWKKMNITFRVIFSEFPLLASVVFVGTLFGLLIVIAKLVPSGPTIVVLLMAIAFVALLFFFIRSILASWSQAEEDEEEEETEELP